jgi:rRNA-processing protein FCF1
MDSCNLNVKKVIVDTNFLLMQFEYGVDMPSELRRIIHSPITLVIPSVTMDELSMLSGGKGNSAMAARFVLQNMDKLRKAFTIEVAPSAGKADEWIIKYAAQNLLCVATNDVPMRKRLLALGLPVIAMKGKSKLDFV